MKTLKALKITSVLNSIFCFFCIAFIICLIINQNHHTDAVGVMVVISAFGFLLNPTPIVSFAICFTFFSTERRSMEEKEKIGKRFIWIFLWPIITAIFYFAAMHFFIEFTGGV